MSGITVAGLHTIYFVVNGEVSSILTASGLEEYYSWAVIYGMLYKRENVNSPEPLKLVFGSNESSYRRRCRRVRIAHPSQPPRAILGAISYTFQNWAARGSRITPFVLGTPSGSQPGLKISRSLSLYHGASREICHLRVPECVFLFIQSLGPVVLSDAVGNKVEKSSIK